MANKNNQNKKSNHLRMVHFPCTSAMLHIQLAAQAQGSNIPNAFTVFYKRTQPNLNLNLNLNLLLCTFKLKLQKSKIEIAIDFFFYETLFFV